MLLQMLQHRQWSSGIGGGVAGMASRRSFSDQASPPHALSFSGREIFSTMAEERIATQGLCSHKTQTSGSELSVESNGLEEGFWNLERPTHLDPPAPHKL